MRSRSLGMTRSSYERSGTPRDGGLDRTRGRELPRHPGAARRRGTPFSGSRHREASAVEAEAKSDPVAVSESLQVRARFGVDVRPGIRATRRTQARAPRGRRSAPRRVRPRLHFLSRRAESSTKPWGVQTVQGEGRLRQMRIAGRGVERHVSRVVAPAPRSAAAPRDLTAERPLRTWGARRLFACRSSPLGGSTREDASRVPAKSRAGCLEAQSALVSTFPGRGNDW
jgi:hypothetical protein